MDTFNSFMNQTSAFLNPNPQFAFAGGPSFNTQFNSDTSNTTRSFNKTTTNTTTATATFDLSINTNTGIISGLQARNLQTRLNDKLAGAGRSVSSGDRFLVMARKGKYVDAGIYQPGQADQINRKTPDVDTKRILQAEAVGYDGENISFRDVTQDVLAQEKMESGAAEGENVAEVAGDGEGDVEYSSTDRQKPIGQLSMANQKHPKTGVLFDGDGFPIFDTKFNAIITPDLYMEKDRVQFQNATKQLSEYLQSNPTIKSQLSERQLKQIALGLKIDGYVWHHHQTKGVLQLVDEAIHRNTWHIGGRSIWGGGALYRR